MFLEFGVGTFLIARDYELMPQTFKIGPETEFTGVGAHEFARLEAQRRLGVGAVCPLA